MDDPFPASARYEVKMTCDEVYLPEVRSWLWLHPESFVEAYPPRQVNNVYLDTFATDHLTDHVEGSSDRHKLRFRWYGDRDSSVRGALELKGRSGSLSWKRQCSIPRTFDLTQTSWNDWISEIGVHADQQARLWLLSIAGPTLLNRYVREYYVTFDGQIRVTLDHRMRVYDQTVYSRPNLDLCIPLEPRAILEVKSSPSHLRRLSDLLTGLPLRVERNSKYVTGMQGLPVP